MKQPHEITDSEYRALAEFRYQIRRFLRFSEQAARASGLEPQQHQLLMALRGIPEESRATIGELAERLQVQHHSMVELADRLVKRGLVQRKRAGDDRREVLLQITPKAQKMLRDLAMAHRDELEAAAPALISALRKATGSSVNARKSRATTEKPAKKAHTIAGAD
jgi:DNA-binding MarR family transcriptional regulator